MDGLLAAPLRLASVTVGLPPAPPPDGAAAAAAGEPSGIDSASSNRQELAVAAEQALRRALVDRTANLAAQRLGVNPSREAPSLHIHLPAASGSAAADGGGSGSRMQQLGLAPSAARRVAGGASVVWVAPPSAAFKWKHSAGSGGSGSPAVLAGGTVEAVAASSGLRQGSAKAKAGQPVPPSAQPCVCKAALFAQWQQLVAALWQLPRLGAGAPGAEEGAEGPATKEGAALEVESLSYRQAKQQAGAAYCAAWRRLLESPSPLEPWIPKPAELEEFVLPTKP